ncbi:multiple C2 and transmembrane domain-containing protein-like [Danaus plexippus]|nr:multiple C2 and transmembrane domain-containing protein-like [Danaus plexippus]
MDSIFRNSTNRHRNIRLWRTNSLRSLHKVNRNESLALVSAPPTRTKRNNKSWNTIVTIILVEAKSLPPHPDDGASHNVYCKFKLGSEKYKSKSVPSSQHPEWRERFQLHLYQDYVLNISLRDKGRMKNDMGSCDLDLSNYEKERSHEIWHELDHGYGAIHISLTMCDIKSSGNEESDNCFNRHGILTLPNDWNVVGLLHVNVICAKGLTSKPNAYCTLQIDNEKVETHRAGSSIEPRWNKCYIFKIYDVTSTLDFKIYDNSVTNVLNDSLGKVSIPLLRINSGMTRWYALKDKSKRNNARGNCPRVLLKMDMAWNPLKATLKLFQAKETQHLKKPEKFDFALIYSNMKFVSNLLVFTEDVNEYYKRLFEWEDKEFSFFVLIVYELFCFYLRLWAVPLIILLPFFYYRIFSRYRDNIYVTNDCSSDDGLEKEGNPFKTKFQEIHSMTFTIKNGIEFINSYGERIFNLVSFKVPFLSYVVMLLLIIASFVLYSIPFNYVLMGLGIYKFGRKYLHPDRVLNNDLVDFLSRVPDNEILKDWKELGVPEPSLEYTESSIKRSQSTSI